MGVIARLSLSSKGLCQSKKLSSGLFVLKSFPPILTKLPTTFFITKLPSSLEVLTGSSPSAMRLSF